MAVKTRELKAGFGFRKQTNISTVSIDGHLWSPTKINRVLTTPGFNNEDDSEDLGKGHEFASQVFPSGVDVSVPFDTRMSSEVMCWAAAFGLGNVVKTGSAPNFIYTCTPINQVAAGEELPYFTYVEQIPRPGGNFWDIAYIGMALQRFEVSLRPGISRDNSQLRMVFAGSGRQDNPSGKTIPSTLTQTALNAGNLVLTIMGANYITLKTFEELTWGWENNIDLEGGYFPGSGVDASGYNLRGRLEFGNRRAFCNFRTRIRQNSPEYTNLKNLSTGTAVITQDANANSGYTATFHKVGVRAIQIGETSAGFATFDVELSPMWDNTNGILTVVGKCQTDNIGA